MLGGASELVAMIIWTVAFFLAAIMGIAFREIGLTIAFVFVGIVFIATCALSPGFYYIDFGSENVQIKKFFGKTLKVISRKELSVSLCAKSHAKGGSVPALVFSPYPCYQNLFFGFTDRNKDCYVMLLTISRLNIVFDNLGKEIRTSGVREEEFKNLVWKRTLRKCMNYADIIDGYNKGDTAG